MAFNNETPAGASTTTAFDGLLLITYLSISLCEIRLIYYCAKKTDPMNIPKNCKSNTAAPRLITIISCFFLLYHQGSFVLYRLFNKNEEESEASDAADSPSTSSPAIAPAVKAENLSQPASAQMSHLLATVSSNEPTSNQVQ